MRGLFIHKMSTLSVFSPAKSFPEAKFAILSMPEHSTNTLFCIVKLQYPLA